MQDHAYAAFVAFFRQAAPYIHAHRHKNFVICFDGEAERLKTLRSLLYDCALMNSLGIHLILVHGARPQINAALDHAGFSSVFSHDKRISTQEMMPFILEAIGSMRIRIESILTTGISNSPMHGASVHVASGNFVIAKPIGVIDGVDYALAGEVRRIESEAIRAHQKAGEIVLLSPLGYSPTGQVLNLNSEEVAQAVATAVQADKLIYISEGVSEYLEAKWPRQISPIQAQHCEWSDPWLTSRLKAAAQACEHGVRRVHLLDPHHDGTLLSELFTRDGIGLMVNADLYDNLRNAHIDDVGGILALIRPLEEQGILVRRSRELLENEIGHFSVLERDGLIIGCAALYPYPEEQVAELACVAIHPDYRKNQRAENLLEYLENRARSMGLKRLFLLTTKTAQWFEEHGFRPISLEELPVAKQKTYNYQRKSKPYTKEL